MHTTAQAPGSARTDIARLSNELRGVTTSGRVTAVLCSTLQPDPEGLPPGPRPGCATDTKPGRYPHHAPAMTVKAPTAGFGRIAWHGRGSVRFPLAGAAANATRAQALVLRAAPVQAGTATDLSVRVTDQRGRSVTVAVSAASDALGALPGAGDVLPKQVMRQIRIPVSSLRRLDWRGSRASNSSPTGHRAAPSWSLILPGYAAGRGIPTRTAAR
jgi:hypothetical protein